MLSLYQKYRPQRFSEITGQEHIVRTLSNSIKKNRISHAYLFTGSRGIGKTTLARIFAKTVNCLGIQTDQSPDIESCGKCENCKIISQNQALDLIEIDAASHTGVDNIRQLRENAQVPPSRLKYKIYIIDEVHMLSIGAFNALLKTLEEPPRHAIFILATTELHKIPETIVSRCQRFDFRRLTLEQIIKRLGQISEKESVKVEPAALEMIALEAEGGMRDAESLLGQIISIEDKEITEKEVSAIIGSSSKKSAFDFALSFLRGDIKTTLEKISRFQSSGINLKNIQKTVLAHLRTILLAKAHPNNQNDGFSRLTKEQKNELSDIARQVSFENLLFAIELLQKNLSLFKETSISQLPLELSAIEFYLKSNPESKMPANETSPQKKALDQKDEAGSKKTSGAILPTEPITSIGNIDQPKLASSEVMENQEDNRPTVSTSKNDITIEALLDSWSQILEAIKPYNNSIHAFLKNCIPCAIQDGKFFIKAKYDFYKERLNESNNQLTIKKVVDKITKCNLKVCIITEKEASRMNFENTSDKKGDTLHDAMKMMGGRIVEN